MSTAIKAQIRSMLLAGDTLPDFRKAFPHLAKGGTLNTYASDVRKSFSPEEAAQAKQAKEARIKPCTQPPIGWLSVYHRDIGKKLWQNRIDIGLKTSEFCKKYNFSNQRKLTEMEHGRHEFTILELVNIAKIIGITLEELVRSRSQKE